ncbi:MAG: YbhB/YbcL family Raf kinase inhibitor-like protein [Gammaproteobacteria bacterium]
MSLELHSSAYVDGGQIPVRFTCDGSDVSPPLEWTGVPAGTRSFALIVEDPDAPDPENPTTTWVHWVLYNIPGDVHELREGAESGGLPAGVEHGLNDWHRGRWGGPCPPIGRHRYFHHLYALDTLLDLDKPTQKDLREAMRGHVLGTAQLLATYAREGGSGS